ncbi:MAG: thiamine-monophosphate kinase [Gaiellaceae bacterium]|jgi:thiamine-monophosphate kinase|nr:thiamine-monophosphate kinase [Gaiellaceae bacterium]
MKLADAGELGLLRELEARGLIVGTEHDAAELAGGLVITQDALVEGVHFLLDRLSWHELGFRAAAVNISDLSASAARPEALFVTLALRGDADVEHVVELYEGLTETGIPVRGGDTTRADQVVVSVTALGRSQRVPGRTGAGPGDAIVVTGPLGAAAAAFREGRLARPPVRTLEGLRLGAVATAMLDISDGIAVDSRHIARRSGCRLVIDLDAVPRAGELDDLGFGEDFELLATVPSEALSLGFPVIGRCEEGEGVVLLHDREPYDLPGYEHFRTG